MTINKIINAVTEGTIYGIVICTWLFVLASIIKWFLEKAKLALNYLFPNCKYFKKNSEKEVK